MKPFVTPDTLKFTYHHLPITKSLHFKPSILFFVASPQKNIDGKNKTTYMRLKLVIKSFNTGRGSLLCAPLYQLSCVSRDRVKTIIVV